jgi:tagatose 1,6-diphosphate aldolase
VTDPGKTRSLQRVTSEDGYFLICALDHLSDFVELLEPDAGRSDYERAAEAKMEIVRALAPRVSAFLLDPAYGLATAIHAGALPGTCGLMSSIENEGYEGIEHARETRFRADWGVRKIKLIGADVCKLLWFYRPDSDSAAHQRDVVKRLVEECAAVSLPLVVEPIWYPLEGEDPTSATWKARRAEGIVASGIEAAALGIDLLKTEFPGYLDDESGRQQAADACRALDAGLDVPWVLLSAGVGFDEFTLQLEIACRAGASGYLAGRSVWRDLAETHEPVAREAAMEDALARLGRLNAITRAHGRPYRTTPTVDEALREYPEDWFHAWQSEPVPAHV